MVYRLESLDSKCAEVRKSCKTLNMLQNEYLRDLLAGPAVHGRRPAPAGLAAAAEAAEGRRERHLAV